MPTDRERKRRDEKSLPVSEDLDPRDLDREVRGELRSLSKETADVVARHLIMAGKLLDEDPAQALAHAYAARAHAARIGVVREAVGIAAYLAGEWHVAITELRAARRMTGSNSHLPLIADSERALGRPEKAVDLSRSAEARSLDLPGRMEMLLVAAGARRDLGQLDTALLMLEVPELEHAKVEPWLPRLRYAYADALLDAGREDEARRWFALATEADEDGATDAAERLMELDGIVLEEAEFDDDLEDELEDELDGPKNEAESGPGGALGEDDEAGESEEGAEGE